MNAFAGWRIETLWHERKRVNFGEPGHWAYYRLTSVRWSCPRFPGCERQGLVDKHLVFVYGTLRRGSAGAMPKRFPKSKFIADAKVKGSLYDLGSFPGLLLNDRDALVIGEVYEVDSETLNDLDDFEASSDYLRKQIEIALGGQKRMCWTYEPNPESYSFQTLITSGDWIEYAKTKTDWPEHTA
jgi:gamma-glutamylcyclotransferase (GGCT)/AIG2-like uncharacterized protein YtfP